MAADGRYFTEDIMINIFQWLPILSCIARFRCVCRSWRTLLSDPNVIRKILFSQTSYERNSMRVLLTGIRDTTVIPPMIWSVCSYETLRPITAPEELHLEFTDFSRGGYKIVGCCDGIFCLAHSTRNANGNHFHYLVLWNPATSETKIIPPGPYHPPHSSWAPLGLSAERIGFGFDPQTNDYKVVRVLIFEDSTGHDTYLYDYDPAQFYHGPTPLRLTEIYSLRNDSWKTLPNVSQDVYDNMLEEFWVIHLHEQFDTSRNEKCYWFRGGNCTGVCVLISFDMSTELFELITTPDPTGLAHHEEEDDLYDPLGKKPYLDHEDSWLIRDCFMLRNGVLMVTFSSLCVRCYSSPDDETWVLLKCGVAESWTKLFTWTELNYIHHLAIWKDGSYICAGNDMYICDIATGEIVRRNVAIEGTFAELQAHVFTPTRISMSQLV